LGRAAFFLVDAPPNTPTGTVDRPSLATMHLGARQVTDASVAPRPGLESVVAQVWRDTLGVPQVWANDNFFDLGGNSLLGVRLLANLEKAVGERLPVSVLFEGQTVRSMAAALDDVSDDDPGSLAVRLRSGNAERPVFVIPGINGDVIGYEHLANKLETDRAVYGLRSLALTGEFDPLDTIEAIAARFMEEVRKVQPQGPYDFVGVCIGGLVAYEIAQRLAEEGEQVEHLVLVGTWPPYAIDKMMPSARPSARLAHFWSRLTGHLRAMWAQPAGERLAYLRRKSRMVATMIERRDVYQRDDDELRRDNVAITNRRAARRYKPAPYAGSALLVLPDSIYRAPHRDPRLTWRRLVRGETTVIRLPGRDSGALLRQPYMDALAEVISSRLASDTPLVASR
jgi:thioesterase domain-containing protein